MNRRSRCLLGTLLVSAIASAVAVAQEPAPSAAPTTGVPRLETTSRDWNFGVVWQGAPLDFKVTLTNVGDAPLIIEDVKSSCGCTVPTKPKSPLAPGESDTMTVSYSGRTKVGQANQTVTLVTNDPAQHTVPITVRGEVKPCYTLDPKSGLVFGSLLRSSQEARTIHIVNKFTSNMVLKLKDDQDFGPYQVELKEVEPGARYELSAATKPPLPAGSLSATVVVLTNFEYIPEFNVTVYGFVPPPVEVRGKLSWPANSVMDMRQRLWVVSPSDQPVEVTGVRASSDAIKVEFHKTQAAEGQAQPMGQYEIIVTLPPGNRIPTNAEPSIENTTNSAEPEFQKLVVPIRVINPGGAPPAPPAAPSGRG